MMHLKGLQSKHKATIAWAQMMQCNATKKKDRAGNYLLNNTTTSSKEKQVSVAI